MKTTPVNKTRVEYHCCGHPAWPDPLVMHDPGRAREWLETYGDRRDANIRVLVVEVKHVEVWRLDERRDA